ncbi:efflux transporter outer membrane subunit [Burkholderia gladioli]|uniref:efflux transporter outer membrane subunit n=1 Tax=Burkholderia gladioli TaxID=28095 RepID=UPI001D103D5F|nr:efflux transporter outer membrane subunit [Burkholderia gladioli]
MDANKMVSMNTERRLPWRALAPAALASLLLAGCMVGPDYHRPELAMADHYHSGAALGQLASDGNTDLARWWRGFDDPVLTRIVERVLAQNLDLEAAQARVIQARAAAGQAATGWLPQGSLDGSVTEQRQSLVSPFGTVASQFPGYKRNITVEQIDVGASWELDLAGGLHRQAEALRDEADAAEASRMGTRVSVVAEAADAYFQLRSAQAAIVLLREQIDTDQAYVHVMDDRVHQGVALDRERDDAEATLAQDRALLPGLRTLAERQRNRLDVLMGDAPGTNAAAIGDTPPDMWVSPGLPADLRPADLLRRRPDVIAAERKLASSTAGIGAALSQYYPDISLSGLLGFDRMNNGSLFTARAFEPTALAGLHWRLFDFGRVDAEVTQAKGARAEAFARYRQSVLRASEDVENALVALAEAGENTDQWRAAVGANSRAEQSARRSYQQGAAAEGDLLLRRRSLLEARRAWVLASGDRARATVAAYRALGGGWAPEAPRDSHEAALASTASASTAPAAGTPTANARP